MKSVFIDAYVSLNLGDDLFIKILCNRYPDHVFYILCNRKFAKPLKSIKNLKVIYSIPKVDRLISISKLKFSFNEFIKLKLIKNCDALVVIGGSIFMESNDWESSICYLQKKIEASKQSYILGSNFGPFIDKKFLIKHKEVFKGINDICFRDKYSYAYFADFKNVRVESDIVFSLETREFELKKNEIVISIIDLSWRKELKAYEIDYINKILEVINLLSKSGYSILLMSFCSKEGDYRAIEKIVNRLDDIIRTKVKSYEYDGDIEEALKLLSESKGILATRFHSMILGWRLNKIVFPVNYSKKSLNVIQDIEYDGVYTDIKEFCQIDPHIILEHFKNSRPINVSESILSANNQFLMLDLLQ